MQPPMINAPIRAIFLGAALLLGLSGCASKAERANDAYAKAQQLVTEGRLPEAKLELLRAVSISDDVPDIWFALGQMRLASGEMPEAFTAFGRADELRPGDANTLRPLAYTGYMIGASRLAQDAVDRLLALVPNDGQGLAVKGLLALDKGESETTLESAEKILSASPNDETGLLLKARAIAVDGKVDDAIKLLQASAQGPEPKPSINFALLQFYRAKSDVAGMQSVFPGLIAAQKENSELALDYANLLYRTGKIAEARKIWSDTIVAKRDDAKFVVWAFEVYDNAEPDGGPVYLDDRLTKMGGSPLRTAAGQFLLTRKEYARALALITQGRGAGEANLGAQAVALEGLGRHAEAQTLVDTILNAGTGRQDSFALMLRAKWAAAAKNFDRANADAQTAIIADPSNLEARMILAQSYLANQQPLRTRQVLAEAVRDLPRSRRALSAYLAFLQSAGDYPSAIAAARNFADSNGSQPWGWSTLAAVCQKINDGACIISAKRRYDAAVRDFTFTNPSRPFKMRGLFSPLPGA
jgi:tetratricopeptide (TPR) repeat protein